jgi:peptidoglycan/LPS O-acetylase OafA/YrhL
MVTLVQPFAAFLPALHALGPLAVLGGLAVSLALAVLVVGLVEEWREKATIDRLAAAAPGFSLEVRARLAERPAA